VSKEQNLAMAIARNNRLAAQVAEIHKLTKSQPESALLKGLAPLCRAYKQHYEAINIMEMQEQPHRSTAEMDYKHAKKYADQRTALNASFADAVHRGLAQNPNSTFAPKVRKIIYS
jgi:hypothetical protein